MESDILSNFCKTIRALASEFACTVEEEQSRISVHLPYMTKGQEILEAKIFFLTGLWPVFDTVDTREIRVSWIFETLDNCVFLKSIESIPEIIMEE